MTTILVAVFGFALFSGGTALVLWAVFTFEREEQVSDAWLRGVERRADTQRHHEERRAHLRSVGHLHHQVYVDGQLALEHKDETTCRAVGAAIVDAQRRRA